MIVDKTFYRSYRTKLTLPRRLYKENKVVRKTKYALKQQERSNGSTCSCTEVARTSINGSKTFVRSNKKEIGLGNRSLSAAARRLVKVLCWLGCHHHWYTKAARKSSPRRRTGKHSSPNGPFELTVGPRKSVDSTTTTVSRFSSAAADLTSLAAAAQAATAAQQLGVSVASLPSAATAAIAAQAAATNPATAAALQAMVAGGGAAAAGGAAAGGAGGQFMAAAAPGAAAANPGVGATAGAAGTASSQAAAAAAAAAAAGGGKARSSMSLQLLSGRYVLRWFIAIKLYDRLLLPDLTIPILKNDQATSSCLA